MNDARTVEVQIGKLVVDGLDRVGVVDAGELVHTVERELGRLLADQSVQGGLGRKGRTTRIADGEMAPRPAAGVREVGRRVAVRILGGLEK